MVFPILTGAGGTPISDKYLKDILSLLVKVAYLWYTIGIYLGFSDGELKTIQSMPSLYTEGVEGFLREMLSRWLRWTPPMHPLPTIEHLANALRKVGQVELAQTLILEWSSGRGVCGLWARFSVSRSEMCVSQAF